MDAVKLPKKLIDGKPHVLIPEKEYRRLIKIEKWKRELDEDLDASLAEGLEEIRQGKAIGPFKSVAELRKSLEA